MFFALIHEFGHLIVGKILGFKSENILIFPFGFNIRFKNLEQDSNEYNVNKNILEIRKILTAFAGPAVNVIIIIFSKIFNPNFKNIDVVVFSNVLIALFNLLPIYPLDGGRILNYLFKLYFSKRKAYTYTQCCSYLFMFMLTFFGSILMYFLKNIIIFFIIIYLWTIVIKEDKIIKMKINFYEMMEKHIQIL